MIRKSLKIIQSQESLEVIQNQLQKLNTKISKMIKRHDTCNNLKQIKDSYKQQITNEMLCLQREKSKAMLVRTDRLFLRINLLCRLVFITKKLSLKENLEAKPENLRNSIKFTVLVRSKNQVWEVTKVNLSLRPLTLYQTVLLAIL